MTIDGTDLIEGQIGESVVDQDQKDQTESLDETRNTGGTGDQNQGLLREETGKTGGSIKRTKRESDLPHHLSQVR